MKPTKLPSGNWRVQVCVGKDGNGKRHFESITRKTRKECIRDAMVEAHFTSAKVSWGQNESDE